MSRVEQTNHGMRGGQRERGREGRKETGNG